MSTFDYSNLSPMDFERLVRDIVQAERDIFLESFKTGKDGGIDLRYAEGDDNEIVQCKHYERTGFAGLLRELRKEAAKIGRLKPTRYLIATTVGLSPSNKKAICEAFDFRIDTADILGRDDLDNLLNKHDSVLKSHFKLWLASTAVLERVLHNAVLNQSRLDVDRIYRDVKRYVHNAAYPRALDILNEHRAVIISGVPGIGKTTLARMILYSHLKDDYEVISVNEGLNDLKALYNPEKRQVFYYDDFLGATFLGERNDFLGHNQDRNIVDFIEIVSSSKNARLVLTTREHILNQAIGTSERFASSEFSASKCLLAIGDYSRIQKAEILYNHIYFSDLPDDYVDEILTDRFYAEIVDHKKFNPRLIEWLANYRRVKSVHRDNYRRFVEDLLDDPSEIWAHAYRKQVSEASRSLLLALYSLGGAAKPDTLKLAFDALHNLRSEKYRFQTRPSDFVTALRELSDSFIKSNSLIEVIDPSVLDMLNALVRSEPEHARDIALSSVRFSQQRRIFALASSEGSQQIEEIISQYADEIAKRSRTLLETPAHVQESDVVRYIDDAPEMRIASLLEYGEKYNAESFAILATDELSRRFCNPEIEITDVGEGLRLYRAIINSEVSFPEGKLKVVSEVLKRTLIEAANYCNSEDLVSLVNATKSFGEPELLALLDSAAQAYRHTGFYDELRNCNSEYEFDALEHDLENLQSATAFDLSGALTCLSQERSDYAANQAEYEDAMYDTWKEDWREEKHENQRLDDLFSTLKRN